MLVQSHAKKWRTRNLKAFRHLDIGGANQAFDENITPSKMNSEYISFFNQREKRVGT